MGRVVLQRPQDGCGDWGRCGDGVTHRLEAVLVADVSHLDDLAVRGGVAVAALGCRSGTLGCLLQDAFLLSLDTVSGLETVTSFKLTFTTK